MFGDLRVFGLGLGLGGEILDDCIDSCIELIFASATEIRLDPVAGFAGRGDALAAIVVGASAYPTGSDTKALVVYRRSESAVFASTEIIADHFHAGVLAFGLLGSACSHLFHFLLSGPADESLDRQYRKNYVSYRQGPQAGERVEPEA